MQDNLQSSDPRPDNPADMSVLDELIDPRDKAYIDAMPSGALREAAFCTVTHFRRPDRLSVGDPIPALELSPLKTGARIDLEAPRDRPLVLIFGSYT